MSTSKRALSTGAALAAGVAILGGAAIANAATGTPSPAPSTSAGTSAATSASGDTGPGGGERGTQGGQGRARHQHTAVTGEEATKVGNAVTAKDAGFTVESVRKDPDGSYDVLGTKDGKKAMYDVSADLATITAAQGGPGQSKGEGRGHHRGERDGQQGGQQGGQHGDQSSGQHGDQKSGQPSQSQTQPSAGASAQG